MTLSYDVGILGRIPGILLAVQTAMTSHNTHSPQMHRGPFGFSLLTDSIRLFNNPKLAIGLHGHYGNAKWRATLQLYGRAARQAITDSRVPLTKSGDLLLTE